MSELKRPEADVLANVQVVTVDLPPVSGEEPHFAQTPEDTGINAPVVAMVRVLQPDGDYLRMQVHDLRDFRSDPAQPDGVHRVPVETGGQQGARARAIRPIRADFLVINPDLWNGPGGGRESGAQGARGIHADELMVWADGQPDNGRLGRPGAAEITFFYNYSPDAAQLTLYTASPGVVLDVGRRDAAPDAAAAPAASESDASRLGVASMGDDTLDVTVISPRRGPNNLADLEATVKRPGVPPEEAHPDPGLTLAATSSAGHPEPGEAQLTLSEAVHPEFAAMFESPEAFQRALQNADKPTREMLGKLQADFHRLYAAAQADRRYKEEVMPQLAAMANELNAALNAGHNLLSLVDTMRTRLNGIDQFGESGESPGRPDELDETGAAYATFLETIDEVRVPAAKLREEHEMSDGERVKTESAEGPAEDDEAAALDELQALVGFCRAELEAGKTPETVAATIEEQARQAMADWHKRDDLLEALLTIVGGLTQWHNSLVPVNVGSRWDNDQAAGVQQLLSAWDTELWPIVNNTVAAAANAVQEAQLASASQPAL